MSFFNNRSTLQHFIGKVWLTKPRVPPPGDAAPQDINICVEENGSFFAIGRVQLAADGIYRSQGEALGRRESDAFRQYIEKLAGPRGQSEADLFRQVCEEYHTCADMAEVAQALGLSKERVRRILITTGAYSDDLVEKIAWLHDGGRGKTVAEIADILKISQKTVQKNLAYSSLP